MKKFIDIVKKFGSDNFAAAPTIESNNFAFDIYAPKDEIDKIWEVLGKFKNIFPELHDPVSKIAKYTFRANGTKDEINAIVRQLKMNRLKSTLALVKKR